MILPQADADEEAIFSYLAQHSLASAWRFHDRVQETLAREASLPTPGMPWQSDNPEVAGLRWTTVTGFRNYLIFMRVTDDLIEVVRLLHGARDVEPLLGE